MKRTCQECGAPFTPTHRRQWRCPVHEATRQAQRAAQPRRGGSGGAWESIRRQVYDRDGGRCQRCGVSVALTRAEASVDRPLMHAAHLQPFGAGGADTPENVETTCERCNLTEPS